MAKWVRAGVLTDSLNNIKNSAVRMLLLKAYAAGDSYATVTGNAIASVVMTSSDFTIAPSGSNQALSVAAKTGTASADSGSTPDLHIAFTDGSANVIWVTDETSNVVVANGQIVNFPAVAYTANQPT